MASSSTSRGGERTRRTLLDAAATLFAAQGIEAVSIRSVNAAAGQGPASVHYHFGSKQALLQGVLEREGQPVLDRVYELAGTLARAGHRPSAHELIEVLAVPYHELLLRDPVRGSRWMAICGQLSMNEDAHLLDVSGEATTVLHQLLRRAYPDSNEEERVFNWSVAVSTLIVMLARWTQRPGRDFLAHPEDLASPRALETYDVLVEFVAGGLEAAMSSEKAAEAV